MIYGKSLYGNEMGSEKIGSESTDLFYTLVNIEDAFRDELHGFEEVHFTVVFKLIINKYAKDIRSYASNLRVF